MLTSNQADNNFDKNILLVAKHMKIGAGYFIIEAFKLSYSGRALKAFCADCKAMYTAINIEAAEEAFKNLKDKWCNDYPGAVRVWENNFNHIRQLFNVPSDIRRVMYTTNAIEAVNSSLRKVTKKGFFENENAVFKIFYLRITGELAKKWNNANFKSS